MGITLTYKPSPQPSPEVVKAMVEEARTMRPLQQWWSEPLKLMQIPSLGVIGMTKVSLPGYSGPDRAYVEVDQGEDFLMMWSDITHIVRALSLWSKRYGVQWDLQLEGERFGSVESSGEISADLSDGLHQLLQAASAPDDPSAREELIAAIDSKYKSRWG